LLFSHKGSFFVKNSVKIANFFEVGKYVKILLERNLSNDPKKAQISGAPGVKK